MNSSGVNAGEDDAVMLCSRVLSYFDTERSKIVASSIVERWGSAVPFEAVEDRPLTASLPCEPFLNK